MKSFLSKNKKLLAISLIGFFIFSSGVAFAYTSQDWLTKATSWANTNCVNPTAATKQKAFFCYLWSKSDEQQTAINNLTTANNTKTTQISDLQGKAKNIWVYDQNNTKLGLAIGKPNSSSAAFFDVSTNRVVDIDSQGYTAKSISIGFTESGCRGQDFGGQAYSLDSSGPTQRDVNNLVVKSYTDSESYNEGYNPTPTYFVFSSNPAIVDVQFASILGNGACMVPDIYNNSGKGFLLTKITPSFPAQVALPLIFKYE